MAAVQKTICFGALVILIFGACTTPTAPMVNATGRVEGPTSVSVGDVVQYAGTVAFSDGVERPNVPKTWASSNQAVATIDASGRLTARTVGTTVVSVVASAIGGGSSTPGTLAVRVN
jgi:Bacterial Ig-like domain (group 2)